MSTIYYLMERAIRIKNQLNLSTLVCVYDQAVYAKAYEIKCREETKFKGLFLMMGCFHQLLMFLAVIGTRFKAAGLKEILLHSAVEL